MWKLILLTVGVVCAFAAEMLIFMTLGVRKLDWILGELMALRKEIAHMTVNLDALTQAVTDEETVEASAIALLTGLAAQVAALKTASTDPATQAAIDALAAKILADKQAMADAVTANTPAA